MNRQALYASSKALQKAEIKPSEIHLYEDQSHAKNFVACIKSRKPTINPVESAIRSDTISHLSDICIRLGRPIRWDSKQERILDDAEATKMLDRPLASLGRSVRIPLHVYRTQAARPWGPGERFAPRSCRLGCGTKCPGGTACRSARRSARR